MAIVDVLKWEAAPGVVAWKHPSTELATWTQLIVSESQEACLLKEGQLAGPFPAGRHTLSTDNYPVLSSLLRVPFGRSPFTAEVWFVQRAYVLDIKWGTSDPMQLEDPRYKIMLPVRAFGQYGLRVEDSAKFLVKLVGTLPAFTHKTLNDYFRGVIVACTKDQIAKYLVTKNVSILTISANIMEISNYLKENLSPFLAEYGVGLSSFFVNSITTDDNDPAVKQLKAALATKAEMEIVGFNYQQKRSFDTLEAAAGNTGGGLAGMMGAGIGLGLGVGVGGGMGSAMGQIAQQIKPAGVACACGRINEPEARFCAACGKPAGAAPDARAALTCRKCGTGVPAGSRFCGQCGQPLGSFCDDCKVALPAGARFCGQCGKKMVEG